MGSGRDSEAVRLAAERQRRRGLLPPELIDFVAPALKVGAAAGGAGACFGLTTGIITDLHPVLYSVVSGAQWFTLGTTYWLSRTAISRGWAGTSRAGPESLSRGDMVKVSGLSGGITGMLAGLMRGPKNIVPAAIVFSILGAGGQALVPDHEDRRPNHTSTTWGDWLAKWSPLTPLSDEEYIKAMRARIRALDVEIEIVDRKIAAIQVDQAKEENRRTTRLINGTAGAAGAAGAAGPDNSTE